MAGHFDQPFDVGMSVRLVVSKVLDIPAVALHDDFFDLGGTSLAVIKTIALLKEEHGLEVSARQFVRDPTISAIVAACRPL